MEITPIITLRRALHTCPEISGQEQKTKALLQQFLRQHTGLELHACGDGFYAALRSPHPIQGGIALRADYDALAMPDGTARHLCGHDGHAAALCGVALAASEQTWNRDIFFLFQPAEETGAGAAGCTALLDREAVAEIYGAHNLPGLPLGLVTTRPGTFACASRGLTLRFRGRATHAAYPENGISPAGAVGALLCQLPELAAPARYAGMTLCTVIGAQMGEKAFGAAASQGEVWLTLRAEHDRDLAALESAVLELACRLARADGLEFSHEIQDVFPATENDPACAEKVLTACQGQLLDVPMRWSEDFGRYLQRCPGAFFGIGAGQMHPPLHTEQYVYPESLLEPTIQVFLSLLRIDACVP